MLDLVSARDKAVYYAINTGKLPNLHLIHTIQQGEGYEQCFGRATCPCPRTHCRWYEDCMALMAFQPPCEKPVVEQQLDTETRSVTRVGLALDRDGYSDGFPSIPSLPVSTPKDKLVLTQA